MPTHPKIPRPRAAAEAPLPYWKRLPALPPPDKRRVVLDGLAYVKNGRITYDWNKIRTLWYFDPSVSPTEFAVRYDIPPGLLRNQPGFSAAEKKNLVAERATGFRGAVLERLQSIEEENVAEMAKRLDVVLSRVEEVAALGLSFVRAKLAKCTRNGVIVPNHALSPVEVSRVMTVAWRASETLKNAVDMRTAIGSDTRARRKLVFNQREGDGANTPHADPKNPEPAKPARRPEAPEASEHPGPAAG